MPVLLADGAPGVPKANREKTTQIMFETFNVPKLYLAYSQVLTLYSMGLTEGMVLESGDGMTHCAPVYEGYLLPGAVGRLYMGGRDLTDKMLSLLNVHYNTTNATMPPLLHAKQWAREMKEKLCYVAQNFDEEMELKATPEHLTKLYTLPDGQSFSIAELRYCRRSLL